MENGRRVGFNFETAWILCCNTVLISCKNLGFPFSGIRERREMEREEKQSKAIGLYYCGSLKFVHK